MAESIVVGPQPGPQQMALASSADICFYGGAAGGGKTYALLLEPLRHILKPRLTSVIFRRTSPQIRNHGGLWDESTEIYPLLGATSKETTLEWTFPSGARMQFAHMQYEEDKRNWQGAQVAYIGFDELTHFTEGQFWYMLSRNRSMCGVRPYMRAGFNPDPDSWVAKLIEWWIDQETGFPIKARAGVLRWFVRVAGEIQWSNTKADLEQRYPKIPPKSLTFIPASVHDNPKMLDKDPGYIANLEALPLVDRARLLEGNWKIRLEGGKLFNRAWFEIVDAVPARGHECRFWDLAATEKKMSGNDPDYTAGVRMRVVDSIYYILDCIAVQAGPTEVDRMLLNITRQDADEAMRSGTQYRVSWEEEGGASGVRETHRLISMLAGFIARGVRPRGDKIVRAKSLAAQAQAGNVKLVRGAWNDTWLRHMHGQPDLPHDDIMDASSGAFNELALRSETRGVEWL